MKKLIQSCVFLLTITTTLSTAQTPVSLMPNVQVTLLMDAHLRAVRICKDPVSGDLFYNTTLGDIYRIYQPVPLAPYDTLVYTVADHGVHYVQGFIMHDSTIYLAGNVDITQPTTQGTIVRGVLQSNGTRLWSTVAVSAPYAQSGFYDHRFSGLAINPRFPL